MFGVASKSRLSPVVERVTADARQRVMAADLFGSLASGLAAGVWDARDLRLTRDLINELLDGCRATERVE